MACIYKSLPQQEKFPGVKAYKFLLISEPRRKRGSNSERDNKERSAIALKPLEHIL